MRNLITLLVVLFFLPAMVSAQRILINENFENSGFGPDSLPSGWAKFNEDPEGGPGKEWAVRDSGTHFVGTSQLLVSKAHNSRRALTIPWTAGNPIADDWVITDSLRIQVGDSLIFWMLYGSVEGFQPYLDSLQIWVCTEQLPAFATTKIATLISPDSNNVWTEFKFSLSQFAGQKIYIAFRYYINTSIDGFFCNIDDVFIGNRSYIGIKQINSNAPAKFDLYQNYPNPFNPVTKIRFDIAKNSYVRMYVYNNLGQKVYTLFEGYKNAGSYEVDFNASTLPSGIYYYNLMTDYYNATKRMVLVK